MLLVTIETGVQGDEENNYISYGAKTQSLQAGKEESVSIDVYAEEGYDTATLYFSLGRDWRYIDSRCI